MKVGDYVRTKDGNIFKIKKIDDELFLETFYYVSNDTFVTKDLILKSSPNIIDLIEVGDYVNGLKVAQIIEVEGYKVILMFGLVMKLGKEDIKSIVTHEQFSQMEYRIGD